MEHGDLEIAERENISSSWSPTRKDLHQLDSQNIEALECLLKIQILVTFLLNIMIQGDYSGIWKPVF